MVDDPRVPVALLIYAVQTVVTTATCIADFLSWEAFSATQKVELAKLYVPYLAVCRSPPVSLCRVRVGDDRTS